MSHTQARVTLDADLLDSLKSWEGRTETMRDTITATPMCALSATLDESRPTPDSGTVLPALWHWLYFLPRPCQSDLDVDGHPKRGGFLPPIPLPRRMWAGGRLEWHRPVLVNDEVERVSTIKSVNHKTGRSGDLVFVVVKHEVYTPSGLAIVEEQDIVYRQPAGSTEPPAQAAASIEGASMTRDIHVDPVLLFRYSALTFNAHRIHYDRPYTMEQEGYPGLVVHGPLLATLLADLVRRELPDSTLRRFSFKAIRPAFDIHSLRVLGRPSAEGKNIELFSENHEHQITMQAIAELA